MPTERAEGVCGTDVIIVSTPVFNTATEGFKKDKYVYIDRDMGV